MSSRVSVYSLEETLDALVTDTVEMPRLVIYYDKILDRRDRTFRHKALLMTGSIDAILGMRFTRVK